AVGPLWSFSTSAGGSGQLNPPWGTQDIGPVGLTGSASYADPTYTIAGAGADIWGSSDAFRFVYQPLAGDGTITARVTSELNTDTYAKAGVMMRESLDAGAADVILDVLPGGWVEFMSRGVRDGSTTYLAGVGVTFPIWLDLARTGSTIVASTSSDGVG